MEKQWKWIKIAESEAEIAWQQNGMCEVLAGSKTITLAIHNNQVFAFAQKCPHASGIMANGSIDALGNVVCPLHRYRFSMQNGRNTSGEGYFLKTYPVKKEGDSLFVGFEKGGFFNF